MNIFSNSLIVRYDDSIESVVIEHPEKNEFPSAFVQIREETFSKMTFEEFSQFLGARLLLLMPSMRDQFKDEIEKMKER